jgi:6-hydroxycyclohex-1-ene-1-carbonyl-CoA dehydrogenase
MAETAYRWEMVEPGAPLVRSPFDPFPPEDGEVIVEVAGCGVCHTDLGFYYDGVRLKHDLPLALGHEISGRVVAAGAGGEDWLGKSVLVLSVIPCGTCDHCRRGMARICRRQRMPGNDIQGGFASHVAVPTAGLCAVDETRLEEAGLVLADISVVADAVTTPYQAVMGSGLGQGDLAVVIGIGGVGGFSAQVANALGATVIAVDIDQAKLDKIVEYGAAKAFNAREIGGRDLKNAITAFAKENDLRLTEWRIFECSGTAAGQVTAFDQLTFGSTLCIIGFTMDKVEVRLSNLMAFDARAIGNWGCAPALYPAALDLVLSGKIQLLPFTERRPLDDINAVFAETHSGQSNRRAIMTPALTGG